VSWCPSGFVSVAFVGGAGFVDIDVFGSISGLESGIYDIDVAFPMGPTFGTVSFGHNYTMHAVMDLGSSAYTDSALYRVINGLDFVETSKITLRTVSEDPNVIGAISGMIFTRVCGPVTSTTDAPPMPTETAFIDDYVAPSGMTKDVKAMIGGGAALCVVVIVYLVVHYWERAPRSPKDLVQPVTSTSTSSLPPSIIVVPSL
jgi:hypothetical protein